MILPSMKITKNLQLKHITRPEKYLRPGFELIKWASNSPKLISAIPKEDLAETEEGPDGVISKAQKMLGISYIPREDVFSFHEYHKLAANVVDTKMKLTSCLPKIFSPNGLILPIIMEGRRCLSMAWGFRDRENKPLSWHTVFESSLQQKVNKWVSSLKELEDLKIKRYLFDSEPKTTEPYEARQKEMFIEGFSRMEGEPKDRWTNVFSMDRHPIQMQNW